MKHVIRLAIVDPKDSSRSSLKNMLLGIDTVWLDAECSSYEYFADVAMQTQPDIALISLDSNADIALDLVGRLSRDLPTCSVLVVSSSTEGALILRAMRAGAKEFLNFPLNIEDFLAALDRIRVTVGGRSGDGHSKSSQVITIAGVSGGVGCTSLAINLACVLLNSLATTSPSSTSISHWAMPTCGSTSFPTTRSKTLPRTLTVSTTHC